MRIRAEKLSPASEPHLAAAPQANPAQGWSFVLAKFTSKPKVILKSAQR